MAELGATVTEPTWLGLNTAHRAVCKQGHDCSPMPSSIRLGRGPCQTCAGNDTRAAERAFRARLEAAGATLLEPRWLGSHKPHRVRCAFGHEVAPWPLSLAQGQGLCRACVGLDPKAAEAAFRARLAELGATLLEPGWLGKDTPHRVKCARGHTSSPRPGDVRVGHGVCRTCVGQDPAVAEAAFRARLAELGATLLEPEWKGSGSPHRVRCQAGHECSPTPDNVRQGNGICRSCAGKAWDAFYVVQDGVRDVVKVGVTSGDPRPRLECHERDGLDEVLRLHTGLPGEVALHLERSILAALRDARETPVRGREYFAGRVLPVVLDLVDNHPVIRSRSEG